jgi:hypothetical protein
VKSIARLYAKSAADSTFESLLENIAIVKRNAKYIAKPQTIKFTTEDVVTEVPDVELVVDGEVVPLVKPKFPRLPLNAFFIGVLLSLLIF